MDEHQYSVIRAISHFDTLSEVVVGFFGQRLPLFFHFHLSLTPDVKLCFSMLSSMGDFCLSSSRNHIACFSLW